MRKSTQIDQEGIAHDTRGNLADDVDALFKLPLAEFTGERNNLAARLKRDGRADDANLVKTLAKPSVSAWAVNQLHWTHRDAFDRLIETGQRLRQAQSSHIAGKVADMRESLDARREALSQLSDLATVLLRESGHNPAPDTIHRITTTLEALSAYAALSDGPTPGRLTKDLDPPGFESFASLIPFAGRAEGNDKLARVTPSEKPGSAAAKTGQGTSPAGSHEVRRSEEPREARIAAAKASLQEAKRSLAEARPRAQGLEAARAKAHAEAKDAEAEVREAEKRVREAQERLKKASAASNEAADRAQQVAAEAKEAAQAVQEAERSIARASKELESLLQESKAT